MEIMPWGKHKGIPVCNLPDSYIWWLYGQDNITPFSLAQEVELLVMEKWPYKFIRNEIVFEKPLPPDSADKFMGKAKSVFRKLSMQFHPDHGGNSEAMKAINLFYESMNV